MASDQVVLYSGFGFHSILHLMCNDGPPELFLLMVGRLSLADQANLSEVNQALRAKVRPVMNGWVWDNPPLPLRRMLTSVGTMKWKYMLTAESTVPAEKGYVACPWCRNVHVPTVVVDPECEGFACQRTTLTRGSYEGWSSRVVSLYWRPTWWHPLVLYGLARYSRLGLNTAALRKQAHLDGHQTVDQDAFSTGLADWKAVWRSGHGLFIRRRLSDSFDGKQASPLSPVLQVCCPCQKNFKFLDYEALRGEDVTGSIVSRHLTGLLVPNSLAETVLLDEADRQSASLLVGRIHGCHYCGVDWQAAMTTSPGGETTIHWSTWYHLGSPNSVYEVIEVLKDRDRRRNPNAPAPLGIGNVARLSGLTNDYPES